MRSSRIDVGCNIRHLARKGEKKSNLPRRCVFPTGLIFAATILSAMVHTFFSINRIFVVSDQQPNGIENKQNPSVTRPFGACLMVKDDNDLLYEWLAYHYINLPLRYVVIGSDVDNSQDPNTVLQRWQTHASDLQGWVLTADDFIHRHGNFYEAFGNGTEQFTNNDDERRFHHHALIHRQKGFLTTCAEFLQERGAGWTLFTDSDEFMAMNPMTKEDESLKIDGHDHFSISKTALKQRTLIRDTFLTKGTVLDLLIEIQRSVPLGACYTIPRLLFGALENKTCGNKFISETQTKARALLGDRFQNLSTLRFFQHAKKGDFTQSKFGKVMIDLSLVPAETLKSIPSNIHRPFRTICGPAATHFPNAYFFLAHYIGGWERYASRQGDHRRNYREWHVRSMVNSDTSACAAAVSMWFMRFISRLGERRAQFLLGVGSDGSVTDQHLRWVIEPPKSK